MKHNRHSIRLRGYDYASPGAYFVTLCTWPRLHIFGDVVNGQRHLNEWGNIAARYWASLAEQYPYVHLDEWVIMPNHVHGIIIINATPLGRGGSPSGGGGSRPAPTKIKPLGQLIGAFKTVSAKHINLLRAASTPPVWQRN